jgi:disulfide bond formation protein DsbB
MAQMLNKITPRLAYFFGFLVCASLLGYALYLQYFEYQDPCPLCIFQRIAFLAMGIVFLIGAVHGPRRVGVYVYSTLIVLIGAVGASIAIRHVWIQHLPADQVPECGPGLSYMLDRLPFTAMLEKVFRGSGECAHIGWTFMGITIPELALIFYVLLLLLSIAVAVMAAKREGR